MAKTPLSQAMDHAMDAVSRPRFPIFKAATLVAGTAAVLFVADTLLRDIRHHEDDETAKDRPENSSDEHDEEEADDADLD